MGAAMLARPEPEAQAAAAAPADNGMLELIQGMLMQQSSTLAKFEKKMDDRTSNLESMSMQGAMNGAKQTSQTGASQQRAQLFSLSISSSRPWLLASADAAWTKSSGSQFSQTASAKF